MEVKGSTGKVTYDDTKGSTGKVTSNDTRGMEVKGSTGKVTCDDTRGIVYLPEWGPWHEEEFDMELPPEDLDDIRNLSGELMFPIKPDH
jgi:hypothetical protein